MLNKLKSLLNIKVKENDSVEVLDIETLSIHLFEHLDSLSCPEFLNDLDVIYSAMTKDEMTFLSFKNYLNDRLKPLLEKMSITPLMEDRKFLDVYSHINQLMASSNFKPVEKKLLNQQLNKFLMNESLPEFVKLRVIEIFIKYMDFKLYNLNQLLTLNHFDLIYFIIENKLFDETIEINYNSFLLFNKNIKDLNYATLQIKRHKLGEFLKFLFQKYEGNQSKKDLELLIVNKVFSSGLLSKKNKKETYHTNFSLDNVHKKDFLIPVHLLEVFESCSTIKEVIINFFGLYNRRLESLVINAFFKDSHINYDIFAWGLLIQPLKVNIDVISNHLENKEYPNKLYQINDIASYDTAVFKRFYNDKRILKLIANITKEDVLVLRDTIDMMDIVYSHNLKSPKDQQVKRLIKKPKKIKELHDFLTVITSQIKQRNFSLKEFQDDLNELEKSVDVVLGLSIKVPKMNYDLIEIGQKLNICVGGGSYAEKINSQKCLIFTVFKKGILSYCIEVTPRTYKLIQAKASFNEPLPSKDYIWLIDQLSLFKEFKNPV